jgi:predicted phosphoribosyltransferase
MTDNDAARPFTDRHEAGIELASRLREYGGRPDLIVLALPRGGVPIGYEVARALRAPLDVFVVRKIGMPGHPEFAVGAIASGGVQVLSEGILQDYGIPQHAIEDLIRREQIELERREREYRQGRPQPDLRGRTVILVDDGLATGSTMRAAVQAVREKRPARIIVAVPVGAPDTCDAFRAVADATICARTPEPFAAVGQWYRDFEQTTDEDVRRLLQQRADEMRSAL